MNRVSDLFGPLKALARIRPPCELARPGAENLEHYIPGVMPHRGPCRGSYAEWHRFLDECLEAGIATTYTDQEGEHFRGFATPLGFALLRRWRWLRDSEAQGLPYEDAELAFTAAFERDREALIEAANRQEIDAALAALEKDRRYGVR